MICGIAPGAAAVLCCASCARAFLPSFPPPVSADTPTLLLRATAKILLIIIDYFSLMPFSPFHA
jgi:hypothetical protein